MSSCFVSTQELDYGEKVELRIALEGGRDMISATFQRRPHRIGNQGAASASCEEVARKLRALADTIDPPEVAR